MNASNNKKDTRVLPLRKYTPQKSNRRPSLQTQEPTRLSMHNTHVEPAKIQTKYCSSSASTEPQHDFSPIANVSPTPPEISCPPQAICQNKDTRTLSRGGKKKLRTYPELQSENISDSSQNAYRQAVGYAQGIVKKATPTAPMMPGDIDSNRTGPKNSRRHMAAKPVPCRNMELTSPIMQELQVTKKDNYFTSPKRAGSPCLVNATDARQSHVTATEFRKGTVSNVIGNRVNITHDLHSSKGTDGVTNGFCCESENMYFQPGDQLRSNQPKRSQEPYNIDTIETSERNIREPVDNLVERSGGQAQELSKETVTSLEDPKSLKKFTGCLTERNKRPVGRVRSDVEKDGYFPNSQDPSRARVAYSRGKDLVGAMEDLHGSNNSAPQTEENFATPLACTSNSKSATHFIPEETNTVEDLDAIKTAKSNCKDKQQEELFEDIKLDSPPYSEASQSSDDGFEEIGSEVYESRRNGRPGMWGRWVQGKK